MNFNKIYVALSIFALIFSGCKNQTEEKEQKINVLATTNIVADVVKNLCGDFMEVNSLMGPGVDPHLYKASHGDIKKLDEADVIIFNGLHLEGKMTEMLENFQKKGRAIAVSDGLETKNIRTINEQANVHDPHIWFDMKLWADGVKYVAEQLKSKFPQFAPKIDSNASHYLLEIDSVYTHCQSLIEGVAQQNRILITSHDAFEYFGRSFNFEVKGLQGISTISESGLKDVQDMINYIIQHQIKAIFVENSVPQKALLSVIESCTQKGHKVIIGGELFSDALGAERTPEGTYLGMVKYNVETIVKALK
ncbi:MAG: zinc ABC transporter substrate-binding protein [Flavobacteriales bacterium]|nr:zinc ABC transporter substrate-binding protein [Flavobacteriales bacterium]